MRPQEVDYSVIAPYFIDMSNGEVIAGEEERARYLNVYKCTDNLKNLGLVLREATLSLPFPEAPRRMTSKWTEEEFKSYGRWIYAIVEPPSIQGEYRVNQTVLDNARRIGLGPGKKAIRRVFGTLGKFYQEIGAEDAKKIGLYDDWSIDDFIAYIRQAGGKKTPSYEKLSIKKDEANVGPDYQYMQRRFRHIGGVTKLRELAGYPMIRSWQRQDFIDWGVKFMQANEGIVPTRGMLRYFSKLKQGPGATTIENKFGEVASYQDKVLDAWRAVEKEKKRDQEDKLQSLTESVRDHRIPPELFSEEFAEHVEYIVGAIEAAKSHPGEALRRSAEYQLLSKIYPAMSEKIKIQMIRRTGSFSEYANLQACIVRYCSNRRNVPKKSADELEYEASLLGVFDDIWPLDYHMRTLKLDDKFISYQTMQRKSGNTQPYQLPQPAVLC